MPPAPAARPRQAQHDDSCLRSALDHALNLLRLQADAPGLALRVLHAPVVLERCQVMRRASIAQELEWQFTRHPDWPTVPPLWQARVHDSLASVYYVLDQPAEADRCRQQLATLTAAHGFLSLRFEPLKLPLRSALEAGVDSAFIVRVIAARKLPRLADAGASWPTPVRVFCLGPGDVNLLNQTHPSHGQSLVRGKAPARILELLWWIGAHDGQPVSVQSCLKALWPDAEPEAAETGNTALPGFAYDQAVYLRGVTSAGQNLGRTPIFKGEANVESFRFSPYGYAPGRGTISWFDSYLVNVQHDAGTCFRVNNLAATPAAQVFDGIDQYIEKLPLPVLKYALNQAQLDCTCAPSVLPGVLAGPRFIIVTHPDFLAAANTLKTHKDALGINTLVVTTQTINGSGGLTATSAQIRSWLASYWDTHLVHPKWLLLMVAKVVAFENFPPANPQSGRTFTAA